MPEGVFITDYWHRFRLGGTQRELSEPVQQTEQLEGWTTYAATVELYDEPSLVRGAEVDIYQVDFQHSTTIPQFKGFVNKVRASSRPNIVKLDLLGPLYRLRRATLSGMNLTGMTEGAAWKAVMDACNVPYLDADVADSGYVLGAQVPIFWRREQQGWEIIRELDQVFGMATIEVHDGRVVRFPYDRAPDQSMIFRTFTAFVDADLFSLDREYWGLDEIVNSWEVRGATWQDANNCSYTPWAKADGPNDAFETPGTRVSRKPFSSDLIQDEALAEAVVRRLMRWWNRDPDVIGIITDNNPNILPGTIVGVKDDKNYGIGLTTAATTNPYLVLTVDRRGNMMELHSVGGDPGDEGTVTHGVEKRCNQTLSTGDLPGLYTPPLIDVPPFYIPEPYVCLEFGGPGGVCPDEGAGDCTDLKTADWTNDNDVWGPVEAGSYALSLGNWVGTVNPIVDPYLGWGIEMFGDSGVNAGDDWIAKIAGTHTLNDGMIALQCIDNNSGAGPFVQSVHFQVGAAGISEVTEIDTDSDFSNPAVALETGGFLLSITKSGDNFTFRYEAPEGVLVHGETLSSADWDANASGTLQFGIVSWTEGDGGSVLLDTIEICPNDEISLGPQNVVWEDDPDWPDDFTISGNDLDAAAGVNAVARSVTSIPVIDGKPKSFRLTYQWQLDGAFNGIELLAEDSADTTNIVFWQPYFANSTGCYFMTGASYNGYATDDNLDFGAVTVPSSDSMTIEWDRPTNQFTVMRGATSFSTIATPTALTADVILVCIAGGGPGAHAGHDFVLEILE